MIKRNHMPVYCTLIILVTSLWVVLYPVRLFATAMASPLPLLTATPTPTPSRLVGVVHRDANLRAGPGTTYQRVGVISAGAEVTIHGANATGDWYQLESGEWIAAFLVDSATPVPPLPSTTTAEQTVQTVAPTSTPRVSANFTPTKLNQAVSAAGWRMNTQQMSRQERIDIFDGHFRSDPGYFIYLIELRLANTQQVSNTLTFDPTQVQMIDTTGERYAAIGASVIEGAPFVLHIHQIGGSMSIEQRPVAGKPALFFTATTKDDQTKEWTIRMPAQSATLLVMAFVAPAAIEGQEMQWPGFPRFNLQPTLTEKPTPTHTPISTHTPTRTPTYTPTVTPTQIPSATSTTMATTTATTGRFEGKVFRSDTDEALAGVTIELLDATQVGDAPKQVVAEATTDAQGRYVLPASPGVYSLLAVITANSEAAFPCTDPTGFGLVMTEAGWLATISTQKTTGLKLFLASEGEERTLAASDVIRLDIDLACQ